MKKIVFSTLGIVFRKAPARLIGASMLVGLGLSPVAGCTRRPLPKPVAPAEAELRATPRPHKYLPHASSISAREPSKSNPVPANKNVDSLVEMLGPPTTVEGAIKQAAELRQAYYSDKEFLPRVETIYSLADASTPQSREVLRQIFFTETDVELRVEMVSALAFVDSEDLMYSAPILQEALRPTQPRELREAALDTIQGLNDSRAIALLLPALTDPDPELVETASDTLEYLQEVLRMEEPDKRRDRMEAEEVTEEMAEKDDPVTDD
jgi:hypothetical protein